MSTTTLIPVTLLDIARECAAAGRSPRRLIGGGYYMPGTGYSYPPLPTKKEALQKEKVSDAAATVNYYGTFLKPVYRRAELDALTRNQRWNVEDAARDGAVQIIG